MFFDIDMTCLSYDTVDLVTVKYILTNVPLLTKLARFPIGHNTYQSIPSLLHPTTLFPKMKEKHVPQRP